MFFYIIFDKYKHQQKCYAHYHEQTGHIKVDTVSSMNAVFMNDLQVYFLW